MDARLRWTGSCWIAAGTLLLVELAHPDALGIGFAASSRQTLWPAVHVSWVLVTILTLFGLAGLIARWGAALGRLGTVGAVVAVPGLVMAAGLFLTEAFVFPVLAREDPALLDLDGRFLGAWVFRLTAGLVGLWFVGLVLVGVAIERARVLPRGTGALLAVATVLFGALEGPFVPVVGNIAVVVFAAAHVWLGVALLRAGLPPSPIGEPPSRTATREETGR
jgi:hypothetical protein